jgi:hypothetical protein
MSATAASADGGDVHAAMEQGAARSRVLPWFSGTEGPTVVTSGLNNPRQISLLSGDGVLLIAEAGKGGDTCEGEGEDAMCIGPTGSVSAVIVPQFGTDKRHLELASGFTSAAAPDGSFAVGSDGASARSLGRIKVIETAAPPDVLPGGIPSEQNGQLLDVRPFGRVTPVADIAGYEAAHDPDGQGVESDPYATLALPGRTLVADAAGNDILSVDDGGNISVFAVFPNITDGACAGQPNDAGTTGCDFVPTSLAQGPDGAIYVGALAGETPGAGRVEKLDPETGAVLQTWDGLTTVTGVAVGRDGAVYASELFGGDPNGVPGQLTRIAADGTRTAKAVPFPAGVAVDKYNNVYVAAFSGSPDTGMGVPDSSGQIWRLRF